MKKLLYCTTFLILISIFSCSKVSFKLNVSVISNDNQKISEAQVYLDQTLIGQTDKEGNLEYQASLKQGTKEITISKEDNELNYSIYKDKINIKKTNPNISLTAKLYTVPKIDIASSKSDKSDNLIKEDDLNNNESSSEETIQVKKDESSPIVMSGSATDISLKESDSTGDFNSVTIYTKTSAGEPIVGVNVSYKNEGDYEFESACTTNESGRCLLRYKGKDRKLDLLYQQSNVQTKLESVEVSNKKVIDSVLVLGKSLDVFVFTTKLGKKIPQDASVLVNKKKATRIGKGLYSYNFFNTKTRSVSLKVQSQIGSRTQKVDTSSGSQLVAVSLGNQKKNN